MTLRPEVARLEPPLAPRLAPRAPDGVLILTAATLAVVGLVAVLSAGEVRAATLTDDPWFFFKRQTFALVLGVGVAFVAARLPGTFWRRIASPFAWATVVLLAVLLVPGVGREVGGARRWIDLGFGLRFQPSEFARLASVLWAAAAVRPLFRATGAFGRGAREAAVRIGPRVVLRALSLPLVMAGLILAEPDFDAAVTPVVGALVVLFVAGLPWRYLLAGAAVLTPAFAALVFAAPYRFRRLAIFLDPFADPEGGGYQILQCWTALGAGGPFGSGFGRGLAKFGYLPAPQTDFVFAAFGEEVGFFGAAAIVGLFGLLILRGFHIGRNLALPFDRCVAAGITALLGLQVVLNLGVVTGLVPTTGVVLPFLSYGGSSLLFVMLSLGILLGLSRRV